MIFIFSLFSSIPPPNCWNFETKFGGLTLEESNERERVTLLLSLFVFSTIAKNNKIKGISYFRFIVNLFENLTKVSLTGDGTRNKYLHNDHEFSGNNPNHYSKITQKILLFIIPSTINIEDITVNNNNTYCHDNMNKKLII